MAFGSRSGARASSTPSYARDMDGTTLLRDPSFLADLRDHYAKRGVYIDDDYDLVARFHRDQTFMGMNTLGGIGGILSAKSASKENRAQQKRLRAAYQKLPMFFEPGGVGAGRAGGNIAGAMLLDPLNLVGFGAGAGASAGIKAIQGGAAAGKAVRAGAAAGAVRGAVAEGAVGTGAGAVMSGIQQGLDLELGLQDNFSVGRMAFDAAAEGVMGGALGSAFGAAGGALATVRAHRPTRIAAVKKINPDLDDAAINAMSDEQMAEMLRAAGVNAEELDKAGAQTEMAMPANLGTFQEGVVTGEELPPTVQAGYGPTTTDFQAQGAPGTTVGLPPYPGMPNTLDVPDLTTLPDEGLARAKAEADAELEKLQADKAADPEYAPDDAEADAARQKQAIDAETQRRAEAAQAQDAESTPAPEGAEAPAAADEAPVAPKMRVGSAAQKLADENGVDIPTVFAGQRSVSKKNVQDYIKQRAIEDATSNPVMVDAEAKLAKIASDVETAGGDVTDPKTMLAEFEREVADIETRQTVIDLYKESRDYAQKRARADKKAAGAAAQPAQRTDLTRIQQRQVNSKKRAILENDPSLTDEQAETMAVEAVVGVKEESIPSNYGETRGGSTTARAGRALEEGTEAAGKSIELRTDTRTGEKYYSVRTAKILRRGFDVGDGRTVINKSDVPSRGVMPRDEAMARAETNYRNGSGPTVIGFTAKTSTRAFNGKVIERGETGYADGVSGKVFATREDYEKYTGQRGSDLTIDAKLEYEGAYNAGEMTAAEAAALIRQHEANQAAGSMNSLHSVPTRRGNQVAAIRFGKKGEVRIIGENQADEEVGLRALLSKNGGPESNPANWELRYVTRPAAGGQKAKVTAFEAAAPGETLEQAAIKPRADGTLEGGAPALDDIAREPARLSPEQVAVVAKAVNVIPMNDLVEVSEGVQTPLRPLLMRKISHGSLTYGDVWQTLSAVDGVPWLETEEALDALIDVLPDIQELRAQIFPRGVKLPEVERTAALDQWTAIIGKLDDAEKKLVRKLFDDMQSGGAPRIGTTTGPFYTTSSGSRGDAISRIGFPNDIDSQGDTILQAKSFVFIHEAMHWLYKHGLTAKERQQFWESTRKFYKDGRLDRNSLRAFTPAEGDVGPLNAFKTPQEHFANQGAMFYIQREAEPEMVSFWQKIGQRAKAFMDFIIGKGARQVDDDLRPIFARLLSDPEGLRHRLHRNAEPRKTEGVHLYGRFMEMHDVEDNLTDAMAAGDDAAIIEQARNLLDYLNSIGTSAAEAQMIANRQGTKVRTSGVYKVVRPQYNAIKVARENLYEIITGSAAEKYEEGSLTGLGSGFQIEGGYDKSDAISQLYESDLHKLLRSIDDLYAHQYELVERGQLNRMRRKGKVSVSPEVLAEVRKHTQRAKAYEKRQNDLIERLVSDPNVTMGRAVLDQDVVIDSVDTNEGTITVATLSLRDLMQQAFDYRMEQEGPLLAHLVGRRLRAGQLSLPDVEVDSETALEIRGMTTEKLADAVFDLLEFETDTTSFSDPDLVPILQELKNRIDVTEGVLPPPFEPDSIDLGSPLESRPTVSRLKRKMDIRGAGAEDMRTMFERLIALRGKGVAQPGDGNLLMESDAAAITGSPASATDGPLLETSSAFRDLRAQLRSATKRLNNGEDSAMADIANMAVRATLSARDRDLIAQLGDNVGETVAKRLRGEATGLNERPNRTEIDDALRKAQASTAYVINGIIKDEGMRKRYFRAHLYGDMNSPLANKPFADVFDARKPLPPSVAPDVAREIMASGGDKLARGVSAFTNGTAGQGQIFYAQTAEGITNHTGGSYSGGPVGAGIYLSTSPQGVAQRRRPGKPANPAITAELQSRLTYLEERLTEARAKVEAGGPHVALHRSERRKLLKNIKAVRTALAENNTPALGVTPVIMAGRSIADLTDNTLHRVGEGLPAAILTYLSRANPNAAASFRSELINRDTFTGPELLNALDRTVGARRMDAMFKAMNYDGVKFRRGPADEIAMYRSEQVSALTNPALTMPEMALPTDTQPRIYDGAADQLILAMEGNAPDPARIEVRDEMRVAQGMEPELSELMADMERSANGEYEPKKVGGMIRTYNRFMRGVADRMEYLGHKQIAQRFRNFELDQRRELSSYVAPLMDEINKVVGEGHILKRTWDYLNEPRRGKGRHRLAHKQSAAEDRILLALRMGSASDAYRALNDAERSAYDEIRKSYRKVHGEMRKQGIPIGDLGEDYFGVVWDQDHIRRNRSQFKNILVGLYNAERGETVSTSPQAVTSHAMDAENFANNVITSIIGDDANGILPSESFEGGAPINNIEHSRVLHFQKYPELHKQAMEFMDGSLMGNIVRYMDQATRKINHTKNFGLAGHIAYDYARVAQEGTRGVAHLLSNDKVVKRSQTTVGQQGAETSEIHYRIRAPFAKDPAGAREMADRVATMVNSGDAEGARALLMGLGTQSGNSTVDVGYERRIDAIIDALRDHRGREAGFAEPDLKALEQNMLYTMRRGQGGNQLANTTGRVARRFNNVTLLAFTTLTSLTDLGMPLLRTGDMKAFLRGWKTYLKTIGSADNETKRALRRIGVGMDGIVSSRLTEMTGDGIDVAQDVFFRGTGLTGWTNMNSQISGLIGLESFRAEHAKAYNLHDDKLPMAEQSPAFKKAFRYLAHFGLDFRKREVFDLKDSTVANAVNQFVSETIFAPTPTQLPAWANNGPWFKTVAQLKSFPMMYERLISTMLFGRKDGVLLGEGIREALKAGDYKTAAEYLGPAGFMLLAPLLGMGANSVKDLVMGRGGEDNDEFFKVASKRFSEDFIVKGILEDQEAFDAFFGHYMAGLFTSGGLGLLGQMMYDAGAQLDNDAYGRERIASLMMGPTFSLLATDIPKLGAGIMAIPDPEGQAKRRTAVRTVTGRIPIAGQIRPFREGVVDAVAGEGEVKSSPSYGVKAYSSPVRGYGRDE